MAKMKKKKKNWRRKKRKKEKDGGKISQMIQRSQCFRHVKSLEVSVQGSSNIGSKSFALQDRYQIVRIKLSYRLNTHWKVRRCIRRYAGGGSLDSSVCPSAVRRSALKIYLLGIHGNDEDPHLTHNPFSGPFIGPPSYTKHTIFWLPTGQTL